MMSDFLKRFVFAYKAFFLIPFKAKIGEDEVIGGIMKNAGQCDNCKKNMQAVCVSNVLVKLEVSKDDHFHICLKCVDDFRIPIEQGLRKHYE